MPGIIRNKVEQFEIVYAGGRTRPQLPYGYRAAIRIDGETQTVASLFFHEDRSTMPDADSTPGGNFVKTHLLMADFGSVVALLNGPRPVYCNHIPELALVWLTTDDGSSHQREGELGPVMGA